MQYAAGGLPAARREYLFSAANTNRNEILILSLSLARQHHAQVPLLQEVPEGVAHLALRRSLKPSPPAQPNRSHSAHFQGRVHL